ncbi:MAG: hypothetical protein KKA55_05940 [Proteobacteria bacterium]|nr:hypothetical protein [Pseudomonadota bacterium]MBU1595060.1 hypothetical protein [Pseudomonadota bacterium]
MAGYKFRHHFCLCALFALVALTAMLSACSVNTSNDYRQYLNNNKTFIGMTHPGSISCYFLPYPTQNHYYAFTTFMGGYHITEWEVELGKVLDATLQHGELRRSFGELSKVSGPRCPAQDLLTIEAERFVFTNCQAQLELTFTVTREGEQILSRRYAATGLKECGKMYWGGGFAMKNAVQQSTKNALDKVLNEFARDYAKAITERASHQN